MTRPLPPTAERIRALLEAHPNVWRGAKAMSVQVGCSLNTARAALRRLETAGLVMSRNMSTGRDKGFTGKRRTYERRYCWRGRTS